MVELENRTLVSLETVRNNIDNLQAQINELATALNKMMTDYDTQRLCYAKIKNIELKMLEKENAELEKAL